ncbi:Hint domain-containing protein [Paracoccaceae bacterium GXU_MW_L88]
MPVYSVTQIYMGNYADLDPVESTPSRQNFSNENEAVAGWGAGQEYTIDQMAVTDILQDDTIREGRIRLEEDDIEGRRPNPLEADRFVYNLGDGTVASKIDSVFLWDATVTLQGGEEVARRIHFVQLQNGDIFTNEAADLSDLNIKSIRLDSYVGSNYYGAPPRRTIDNTEIVCFARGTWIELEKGHVPVENLAKGDRVRTRDHGYQPIRWIGGQRLSAAQIKAFPNFQPIRISAGALDDKIPETDLIVSPQHRLLVRSKIAARMFDSEEVLVAAKQLLELDGIARAEDLEEVEYFHILCDRHEIIFANGAETESLYTGPQALKSLSPSARAEIFAIFPELRHLHFGRPAPAARPLIPGKKARRLAARHLKNKSHLVH